MNDKRKPALLGGWETETLSLRSHAIPTQEMMIWVYFLIGLKTDWLSGSKHSLFIWRFNQEAFAFSQLFCKLICWGSYHIQPRERRGTILLQEQAGPACAFRYLCLDLKFWGCQEGHLYRTSEVTGCFSDPWGDPIRLAKFRVSAATARPTKR